MEWGTYGGLDRLRRVNRGAVLGGVCLPTGDLYRWIYQNQECKEGPVRSGRRCNCVLISRKHCVFCGLFSLGWVAE